jgi:hypothetical protein
MGTFSISAASAVRSHFTVDNKVYTFFTTSTILDLALRTAATVDEDKLNFWLISQFRIPQSQILLFQP